MADASTDTPGPFDVSTIDQLVSLMSRHDLNEIDLRDGSRRIRLLRGVRSETVTVQAVPTLPAAIAAPVAAAPAASPTAAAPAAPARTLLEIKSPTVGTFYNREKPDAAPYVNMGSRVTPTTVVGLVEAMKLFNEIPAGFSGVIVEILVENQEPVEYDQVLFRVDPNG